MSDHRPPEQPPFPAPGAPPPPGPVPPSSNQDPRPVAASVQRPPWSAAAALRPGAFPLRPLTLGTMYDGAFRIIRHNPRATVGAAALVTAVAMLIPVVVTIAVETTLGTGFTSSGEFDDQASTRQVIGLLAAGGSLLLGMLLAQLGIIFVTGMIAFVTREAGLGRTVDLVEAWRATRGRRWRLIGLTLLIGLLWTVLVAVLVGAVVALALLTGDPVITVLVGIVLFVATICLGAWLWIRLAYLASVALMLEDGGIRHALSRSWRLTGSQFWRTFGIALLTVLITGFAGGLLTTPLSIVGQVGIVLAPQYTFAFLAGTQALALVVQNAFVAPFSAAVASVQYLDLRIRSEGYDVELMREAGILSELPR